MTVRIYHNSRCSKSRGTLELLQARGIEPEVVNYLDTPPGAEELHALLRLLGMTPRQLLRTGEAEYQDLGLADPAMGDEAIVQAMVTHPKLIERPIVVANGKAAIGRPPEAVLAILS
jgi:arsenate reductase